MTKILVKTGLNGFNAASPLGKVRKAGMLYASPVYFLMAFSERLNRKNAG